MEGKKKKIPIWIWILVVVGVMAGSTFFQQRRVIPYATYTILLKNAKDVSTGTSVHYRGVYAGRVLDAKLSKGGKSAEIVIHLKEDVELRQDAKFTLKRHGARGMRYGAMGMKYIEVTDAGSSPEPAENGQVFTAKVSVLVEAEEDAEGDGENFSESTMEAVNVTQSQAQLRDITNRLNRVEQKLDRLTAQVGKLPQKR